MAKKGQRADEVRWQIRVKHEQPAHNKRVHCVTIFLLFPRDRAEWFKEQMETAANSWVLEWIQATLLAGTWVCDGLSFPNHRYLRFGTRQLSVSSYLWGPEKHPTVVLWCGESFKLWLQVILMIKEPYYDIFHECVCLIVHSFKMVFLLTLSWDLMGGYKINLGRPVTQCWHFYVFLHNFEHTMKNNKWQKLKCPWQTNKQNSTLWYFYLCFPSPHTVFTPTELEILTQHVNLFLPELPWPLHLTSLLEVLQTKWLAPSLALLIRHITWLLFFISLNVIGICEAFERHVWDYILCSWLSTASCFKCVVL